MCEDAPKCACGEVLEGRIETHAGRCIDCIIRNAILNEGCLRVSPELLRGLP